MDVICHVVNCPFFGNPSGFCTKRLISINANGQCGHIYLKNGAINPRWQEKVEIPTREEEKNGQSES